MLVFALQSWWASNIVDQIFHDITAEAVLTVWLVCTLKMPLLSVRGLREPMKGHFSATRFYEVNIPSSYISCQVSIGHRCLVEREPLSSVGSSKINTT